MNIDKTKRIITLFLVFVVLAGVFGMQASAYDEQDYVVVGTRYRLPIPVTYNAVSATNYFGEEIGQLANPTDIFVTDDDRIFIVDGGNNRIVSMNTDYSEPRVFDNFSGETLNNPNGIYIYENGDMLIADTDNGRILKTDKDGNLLKTFVEPKSEMYERTYPFKPRKVYVNIIGQIYIINTEDYHGFIVIDENNEFQAYTGQFKTKFSLKNELIKIFASKEHKEKIAQELPPMHTNFIIDDENAIYVTTARAEETQLQRISPVGKSVYPNKGYFGEMRTDPVLSFYNKQFTEPQFVDVTVNDKGVVTIIDSSTGRLYQYDQEGNNLLTFGGTGIWKGKFTEVSGLEQDSLGNLYVIDRVQSNLHVFEPTDFTKTIHTALGLYYNARYDEAVEYWNKVLDMNPNYPLARSGLGKAFYRDDQYEAAMEEFYLAYDTPGYSDAFDKNITLNVRNYFGIVLFSIIAAALAVVLFIIYLKKRYKASYERQSRIKWLNNRGRLRILLGCIFDPNEGFRTIRDHRTDFDYKMPILLYFLVFVSRILSLFGTHYPFRTQDVSQVNLVYEIVFLFFPILLWTIGNYLVTTISSGEVRLREVFSASAYCMIPYIILTPTLTVFSRFISSNSYGIYNGINSIMWVWVGIMFFVSVMAMNSYRFFETIKIILLTLFACVFMMVVVALLVMLGNNVIEFVREVYENIKIYMSLQGGNM